LSKIKNVLIVLFGLFVCGAIAYFAVTRFSKEELTLPHESVRIGITLTADSIPAIIAEEEGFFKEEGLNPVIVKYTYGAASFSNLLDGKVDLAMLAETPLIVQSFNRKDFVVIANISSTYQGRKIVALTDKGIHSILDLRGKKIGVLKNTSAHYFLEELLLQNNVPLKDVKLVFLGLDETPEALKSGKVDAIAAFEPYPQIIEAQWPAGTLWVNDGDGKIRTAFSYVMTKDYLKTHKEVAKKVIRATAKAIAWMQLHPNETISIAAKTLEIDPAIMRNLFWEYRYKVSIDEAFLLGMRQQALWYQISNPAMSGEMMPTYTDFVDPTPLSEAIPGSVNYVH